MEPRSTVVRSAQSHSIENITWRPTPFFTLWRNRTSAHSVTIQPKDLNISEYTPWNTLGWNHTIAISVNIPQSAQVIWKSTKWQSILEKSRIAATNVNIQQLAPAIWGCTKEPTQGKNLIDAQHAIFRALEQMSWNFTWWGIIQEKKLTTAASAIMFALLLAICGVTWESTMDSDLSIVTNAM